MTASDVRNRLLDAVSRASGASSDYDLNPNVVLPAGRVLRPAGVLVPFVVEDGEVRVVLTKRSSALKHHPGQVAFPGGKVDAGDDGPVGAALREAEEEVGLPRESVEVLGELPSHETVTGFRVTPVLGWIERPFIPRPEPGEVEEVFTVPFDHLADPSRYTIQSRRWRGMHRFYYALPFGPYYVWGATARMLRGLCERLAQ
ncbi:CoA pyrophosphatase [Tranquillimonas alkanivorans]|uniref:8-oxo-dGTP pyrophosphatase MutT, NUDIX family n=1 Tax=Tranquillimonas alkanivorans TaxID=441119 RepID=A0A1I5LFK3_9RHOB|nr:CoA pyrophosphatase [Tranquillimonas alkanivorans]SFO96139.1 8-oxo-dGTP pyrophosphatase MutT, NUDIX family [Tranquillimonas alkanivorans]